MKIRGFLAGASVVASGVVVAALVAPVAQATSSGAGRGASFRNEHVCGVPALKFASCAAVRHVRVSPSSHNHKGHKPPQTTTPVAYVASQLQAAYGLTSAAGSDGSGKTVAVVDAYNDPNAYSDLVSFRTSSRESLGGIAQCTVSGTSLSGTGPCFAKVNQSGAPSSYPTGSTSWGQEISLDLDTISSICPKCNILLVEANSNSLANLGTAVNTAASFKPVAIGNSYGGGEFSSEATYASEYYNHSGIAITAATGDSGYGVEFPAAAQSVIAVGGTTLNKTSSGWSQTVWSGTGSGCSAYIAKPAWQHDKGCSNRTVSDVSADANPNTGEYVYDTYGASGWLVFGGTSVSAQILAGIYGLAGGGVSNASGLYTSSATTPNSNLYDVVSGSNGSCTGHGRNADKSLAYLCTAETGYDGPSGMGTPKNGISGF